MAKNDTIRVFVGCAANGEDAESQLVLEWSLKKHASQPVDITWMRQSRDAATPWGGWQTQQWATPFSGFRWAIPAACKYRGRAIYLDSDMIAVGDIAELWNTPFEEGKVVQARGGGSWRFCCSMWDNKAAKAVLPALDSMKTSSNTHAMLTQRFKDNPGLIQAFPDGQLWNWLDVGDQVPLEDPSVRMVHYTNMATQPHHRYAQPRLKEAGLSHWYPGIVKPHPRADVQALFDAYYEEALSEGYRVDQYVPAEPFGSYSIRGKAA